MPDFLQSEDAARKPLHDCYEPTFETDNVEKTSVKGSQPGPFASEGEDEQSENMGASMPLLDLVDTLFEMRTRGFVLRQVDT